MMALAYKDPQKLAAYSVSDALCTYHLYIKYVHPFIFSLSSIIPLSPDDVLRKGTGALCETLLMAEAFQAHIIMPDKTSYGGGHIMTPDGKHLIDTETYVGGHVEALESGVFRSDLPVQFNLDVDALGELQNGLRETILFSLLSEHGVTPQEIEDLDSIIEEPKKTINALIKCPTFEEKPLIYHLDVAAMYPNIILTNRLQPPAIVSEESCALCDHNRPGKRCQRSLEWSWRGEHFVAQKNEIKMIQNQLSGEVFQKGGKTLRWADLSPLDQETIFKKRLSSYCRKIYNKIHSTSIEKRTSIVCQKENPFYVDTVKRFRDRRYEYKTLHKEAKKTLEKAFTSSVALEEAKKLVVLYDSLQLAHKVSIGFLFLGHPELFLWICVVCETGGSIIRLARQWMERLGRPLELDTDGIWLMLPASFPDSIKIPLICGRSITLSYPCVLLNRLVHSLFTNDQYHSLLSPTSCPPKDRQYEIKSENSIFFEIDGPYRAMILPASMDEDRLLKKRYAVFSSDGSLAELKGFEVKRRGELRLTKLFQSELFNAYLEGSSLLQCYEHVSKVASKWLDLLDSKAKLLSAHELFELVTESRTMSKPLSHYSNSAKSPSLTTAKRLSEFLGNGILAGGGTSASLTCAYVIANGSSNFSVAEKAIPVAIWSAESEVREFYLTSWIKSIGGNTSSLSLHDVLDWAYYKERFISLVLKLIVIPAAMQGIANPFGKRVQAPSWLMHSGKNISSDNKKIQQSLKNSWKANSANLSMIETVPFLEDPALLLIPEIQVCKSQAPRHELLHSSYKKWLQAMRFRWSSINVAKKKRGTRWSLPSFHQGPCSVLGVSLLKSERKFRVWLLPLYYNGKGGPLSSLQRFDIEIQEAFSVCVEVEPAGIASFLQYCKLKHWSVLYEQEKAPYSILPDGTAPEGVLLWITQPSFGANLIFHQNVLAIYEMADPHFKALLEIGAVVKGSTSICTRKDEISNLYLPCSLPILFVFHSEHKNSNFLLIISETPPSLKAIIISSGIEAISKSAAEKIALSMNIEISSFTIDTTSSTKQFANSLLHHLNTIYSATSALLVIQSNSDLLSRSINQEERPILWRKLASSGPSDISQALALSQYYLKESFHSFLSVQPWIKDELDICRTLNIPLCRQNWPHDEWANLDIAYVRSLRASGRVFSMKCDQERSNLNLGEYLSIQSALLETKNCSLNTKPLLGVSFNKHQERPFPDQSCANTFLNQPGFYENVCFKLELNSIFICAVLEASVLIPSDNVDTNASTEDDAELCIKKDAQKYLNGVEDSSSPVLRRMNRIIRETLKSESFVTSLGAFPIHTMQGKQSILPLINLVSSLLKKQAQGMSGPIVVLGFFDNWICNSSGPASNLLGSIYQLRHKLFLLLISEFNRLGLTVVTLGNQPSEKSVSTALLIATNKSDESSALYHLNWAIGEIAKTPGLCWIDLNLVTGLKRLFWMDRFNYFSELLTSDSGVSADWIWSYAAKLLPQDAAAWASKAIHLVFEGLSSIFPTSEDEPQFSEKIVMDLFGLVQEFATAYDDKENNSPHVSIVFARLISMLLSTDSRISMVDVNSISRSLLALASGTNVINSSLKTLHLFDQNNELLCLESEEIFVSVKCQNCTSTCTIDLAADKPVCPYCHFGISESQATQAAYGHLQILLWDVCSASDVASFECYSCGTTSNRSVSKWCPKCTKAYSSVHSIRWKTCTKELERVTRIFGKKIASFV
ncbi:DNA polymerase [Mitosporidium daphniae]|uniref:DNA polymerase epsilon catalytic subunit n=1 Tax=Mitosporidium daphniae TaxID=1485682 RepID=A0A098VRF3_9MICR|nr:DNA polymerase [Mitosporidium daphniae]KGG51540.1 DNA polymerase [Mitosporidium daphniae]|eukprot:XP_013237967.1 DNA polymerase [Mitosporidium daphniae]